MDNIDENLSLLNFDSGETDHKKKTHPCVQLNESLLFNVVVFSSMITDNGFASLHNRIVSMDQSRADRTNKKHMPKMSWETFQRVRSFLSEMIEVRDGRRGQKYPKFCVVFVDRSGILGVFHQCGWNWSDHKHVFVIPTTGTDSSPNRHFMGGLIYHSLFSFIKRVGKIPPTKCDEEMPTEWNKIGRLAATETCL